MANCFCLKWRPDIVKALDFRHCNLLFVPEEVFEFGETLEELFLDSNDIRDLPRPLFHCQNLKKLGASDNELFSIPPAIASLINLKELDISKNGIVELPDAIKGCRELDLMEVSVNPLGRLPDGFTQLINLTQLYLNDTLLDYLPANFGRLVKLTVLELRENHLKSLPKSVAKLTSLERLDLGQNCFEEVPDVLGSLSSLQEFWIDANKVNKIAKSIGSLRKLFYFDASRNRIEELPSTIAGWDGIKDIHLSKNFIQKLPVGIGELSTLSTLRVDNNQLSSLPYSIGGLVSLEELILNANDLEDIPPSVGLLRKLRHLNVDDNMLITLPAELGSCNKISLLSLRGNYLEWLPDEIGRISSLVVANFSNNRLKYLPYNFTKLKNLQALWLSENQSKPLIQLQSEIREESGKRVLTCFLLPQLPPDDMEYDDDGSDSESFHMSVWSQQRRQKMVIAFDVSESEPETVLESKSRKQAYPKETYRPKFRGGPNSQLSNGHVPSGVKREDVSPHLRQRDRVRGRRELAEEEGSIAGSLRSSRPRSPASSTISDTHSLFKADKEKHAKDKARIRKGSLSPSKAEKGSLQVQWELPVSHQKESKKRRSNRIIIKERASHSDSEVLDSHPMKVRTPRSERKPHSRHARHMDEADREVAQLTNSLRESSPERENQTDTELFTKKDMPDVVFQQSPYMHSLVTRSASMDFKASPMVVTSREQLRDRRPNGYLPHKSETPQSTPMQESRLHNSRVTPSGHTPDAPSTSRRMNGNLRHRTGRSLPGTPKSHTGSPGSKRRTLSGPAGRDTATTGVKDYDERKDSHVAPAVQHHVVHQQGRDSGISIPQTPSGYVTDPELERLYQMRYRQGNTPGRSGGNSSHGENMGQRGSQTRGNLRNSGQMVPQPGRKSNSGYSSDRQGSNEVAMRTGGEESMGGREGMGRDRVEDVQQRTGSQEWRYNVKTEATSRVNVPRSYDSGKEVRWQSQHPTSTPGRNNNPSVGGDLSKSHQRDLSLRDQVLQADTSQQGYVKNSPMSKPWDPRQSPSRHRPDTGSASIPASGEYSDQLRRVSGHLLSAAGSFLSHQQERTFSNTPSISYQQPPSSMDESEGVKGARRHLRFSSENQSLVRGNQQISRLSSSQSGVDNRSVNSHPSKAPLPNRTYSSEVTERRSYEDVSTLQEASQRSSSLHTGNNTDISEQTFTEGGGEYSNSSGKINGANNLPYKERAVDVPPEFLEMEEKFDRATKLQTEPASGSQLGRLHPSHYSTPYNQTVSSLSSSRPFSSPRSTGVSVMSQGNQRNPTEQPFAVSQNERTEAGTTAKPQHFNGGGDSLDAGVQWAVPSWVRDGDDKPDGHYSTDINKNRSYGHDWSDPDGMSSSQQQRGREGNRQVNRNNSNLVQTVEQRDIIPTSSTPRTKKLPTSRDINEQNWRNHLMDHLQKRSGQNPDESDDVFHSSGPSPSPPSYHKAISNSYPMPPYVMRRSLPVPASVSQIGKDGEDVRRE
ncbi:uncharacterized protein [Apostichopus japonicus]|uniref:uncharacterized protein isoform X2 n=1 Tax=Stichopus japonicus TaxID=307972 RepID=UPI003AB7CEBA